VPPSGLAALFEQHRRELARFLSARCGDPHQAEELMQDLWIKLSGTSPGPIANGRAYLFRMANNLMLDTLRARRRAMARDHGWLRDAGGDMPSEVRPDPAPSAVDSIIADQERAVLHRAISDLPPGAARALRLHRFEGLAQGDVAREMGISRSGVEKHLATAMRHLRRALADCGFFATAASLQQEDGHTEEVPPETTP
jgi:RNA polymerase sigma-70 factor (ECF subfamily)